MSNEDVSLSQAAANLPGSSKKPKKPFYKKWWVWVIAAVVLLTIIGSLIGDESVQEAAIKIAENATQTVSPSTSAKAPTNQTETKTQEKTDADAAVKTIMDNSKGKPAADIYTQLKDLGYSTKFSMSKTKLDATDTVMLSINNPNDPEMIQWMITDFDPKSFSMVNKTVTFFVDSSENITKQNTEVSLYDALNKKLDRGHAWQAVQAYGKVKYPYGFTLHWIMGKLAERPQDANTWFLKASCDVTNAYGAKEKGLDCEAEVTGTTDNPKVISFMVY